MIIIILRRRRAEQRYQLANARLGSTTEGDETELKVMNEINRQGPNPPILRTFRLDNFTLD